MEDDLKSLTDWFLANKLSLNVNKTNFIIFQPNKIPEIDKITLSMGNELIKQVVSTKFLGIHIDKQLQWDIHINYITQKIASGCYAINAVKRYLSRHNLKTLYYSLVHSYISYGTMLWGNAHKCHLAKIERLQRKAIRNVCKAKYNSSSSHLFKELRIPKVEDIYNIQLAKYMYSHIINKSTQNIFEDNFNIHSYNTRQRNFPHILHRKSQKVSRTFIHQGPKLWLRLPLYIKSAKSIKSFCNRLKYLFISKY